MSIDQVIQSHKRAHNLWYNEEAHSHLLLSCTFHL
jgi:hypothetical protein